MQEAADRLGPGPDVSGNLRLGQPLAVQGKDRLIPFQTRRPVSALGRELPGGLRCRSTRDVGGERSELLRFGRVAGPIDGGGRFFEHPTFAGQDPFEHLPNVGCQGEAVGHLDGIGGALAYSLSVSTAPVAGDHRDARMSPQPGRESRGGAILQEVDDVMSLEVYQDGAVGLAPLAGPIVDAQHARGGTVGLRAGPDQAQDRGLAPHEPPSQGEPGALTSSRCETEVL